MATVSPSTAEAELELQKKASPCYQCGVCSGGCPAARFADDFRPRKIVLETQFGESEEMLKSDVIWKCAACYNCYEHCPQGIKVTDIIMDLQSEAIRQGEVPKKFTMLVNTIYKNGLTNTLGAFGQKQREKYGLSAPPSPDVEAAKRIIEDTGILSLVKKPEEDE
jgi:heterodisulfide reductase subunit C